MNKIFIIIGREFTTRVKKKSFLITTIAVPLLFVAFYAFLMWMMLKKDTQERQIAVINASSIKTPLEKINNTNFIYTDENITQEESADYLQKNGYYAILWIPANVMEEADITINSFSQIPPELESNIHTQLQNKIENIKKAAVITETNLPDLEKKTERHKNPGKNPHFKTIGHRRSQRELVSHCFHHRLNCRHGHLHVYLPVCVGRYAWRHRRKNQPHH